MDFAQEMMSFLDYARINSLSGRERLLWIALCKAECDHAAFAQTGQRMQPDEWFSISNAELTLNSTLDKRGIEAVRNQLKQRGLIDFRPGNRTKCLPSYRIFHFSENTGYKNVPSSVPSSVPSNVPSSVPSTSTGDSSGYKNAPSNVPSTYNNNIILNHRGMEIDGLKQDIYPSIHPSATADDVRTQISYDSLLSSGIGADVLDGYVTIITDVLNSTCGYCIQGCEMSNGTVVDRFRQLDENDISYVNECMKKCGSEIRNLRSYLITSLFNAKGMLGVYYDQKVSQLFYGER